MHHLNLIRYYLHTSPAARLREETVFQKSAPLTDAEIADVLAHLDTAAMLEAFASETSH